MTPSGLASRRIEIFFAGHAGRRDVLASLTGVLVEPPTDTAPPSRPEVRFNVVNFFLELLEEMTQESESAVAAAERGRRELAGLLRELDEGVIEALGFRLARTKKG